MRVVSGPKLALLNSARLNFFATAKIEDGDGILRDMTNILAVDFFDSATWTENIDQPVASGTITLRREAINGAGTLVSLAPSMQTSPANKKIDTTYSPLLVAGRRAQILVAWTVADVAPVGGDWMLVFDGKIDNVNPKGQDSLVTLDVRDRGAWLLDTFIEEVRNYSDSTGVPVETIMQQILDDNPNAKLGAVTLYVPTSPGWNIKAFSQDQKGVLDALRDLAQQIGWDVRYLYREATAQYELTLYLPDRTKAVADWTLGPDQYLDVTDLKVSDQNVRNRIRVRSKDSSGAALVSFAIDAASVSKFGPRYMEVNEDSTTNIDTQTELDDFADAMLSDLSDPIADQEIENLLYPVAQLGDLGKWLANGKQYDTDQSYAVVQVRHDVQQKTRRTYIQSRGRVAGAFNRWLTLEDTGGASTTDIPPSPTIGPVQVEGTARDGAGEAAMHVPIVFEKNTTSVLIYATEAAAGPDPPAPPDLTENRLAATVIRHEGDIASADNWQTEVTISTTSGFQRRIIALPIGPGGLRGNPFVAIELCADTGAAPTAPPINLVVTMSTVGGVQQAALVWDNNGDAVSFTRVWRNGIILVPRVAPGVTTLDDIGISPGVTYAYNVQHIRNGQTSDFAASGDTDSDSPGLATPLWFPGYPRGAGYVGGNGIVIINQVNPDELSATNVFMSQADNILSPYDLIATIYPPDIGVSLNASLIPHAATNAGRYFYLVAIRDGYVDSAPTTKERAVFGP